MVDNELLKKYRNHPRIIEIKLAVICDLLSREYGYNNLINIIEGLCAGFKRPKDLLMNVVNRRFDIMRYSVRNKTKWRQEVLFMGACFGYSNYQVCRNFLDMNSTNIYNHGNDLRMNYYVTEEWLEKLDDEVIICGSKTFRDEVKAFFQIFDSLVLVLNKFNFKEVK